MPMYTYQCPRCAVKQSVFKRIAQLDLPEACEACDEPVMQRIIEAPAVFGDYPGYDCPITGKWIEGKRAHTENLKQHGCRVLEPGENEEAARRRDAGNAAFEEMIAESAVEFVETLPARKREQLQCELDKGVDVSFTRM